jgi:hypothetical protein
VLGSGTVLNQTADLKPLVYVVPCALGVLCTGRSSESRDELIRQWRPVRPLGRPLYPLASLPSFRLPLAADAYPLLLRAVSSRCQAVKVSPGSVIVLLKTTEATYLLASDPGPSFPLSLSLSLYISSPDSQQQRSHAERTEFQDWRLHAPAAKRSPLRLRRR